MAPLQTVSNALDVLTLLGKDKKYLSVEYLAEQLKIPESSVYRMIQTLEAKGFVERHSRNKICLGSKLLSLAYNVQSSLETELCIVASSLMEEICNHVKETTILSVRTDLFSKCIKNVDSKQVIRFVAEEQRLLPLYLGASSRSILAYEDSRIIKEVLDGLPDEEQKILMKRLVSIKECGYSISNNEQDSSALGIGVPIFNVNGGIFASLAIVGPDSRISTEDIPEYVEIMKSASEEITNQLKKRELLSLQNVYENLERTLTTN